MPPPEPSGVQPSPPRYGQRSLPPDYGSGPPAEYGAPPMSSDDPASSRYASWGHRVLAVLLDGLLSLPFILVIVGGIAIGVAAVDPSTGSVGGGATLGLVGVVGGWVGLVYIQIWNRVFRQGRTGQSWGKRVLGLKLFGEASGEPIGPSLAFAREVAHLLDLIFFLGYLWPLWDGKRQTFADKVCRTVVLARAD